MKLNSSQKRAVAHLSGPMMVLAGPGSGKTSVIVERISYLIEEGKVAPGHILVVTFSRAAAKEMKERFLAKTGETRTDVTFGTFHGVFFGILVQAYHLTAANILTEKEKNAILRELAMEACPELAAEGDFLEDVQREISTVKENRIDPEHYYSASCPDEVFRKLFHGYTSCLNEKRKLDFDDMLLYSYRLFVTRPDILKSWQEKFTYILVDEFQDINHLQYDIIRMLAEPERNLFVVGDDDQSIYHFRGARPEIMLQFGKEYPEAAQVLLDVNYRCPGNVLETSMRLIGHNRKRFQKKLETPNPPGERISSMAFETPAEQFRFVVKALRERMEKGETLSDTALLFRTNQEAEELVRILMEYQVPFIMREQLSNLFDHWICHDLLSYMHMAAGPIERKDFLAVMNRPNRYIKREAVPPSMDSLEPLLSWYSDKDWMTDRLVTLQTHLRILAGLNPFASVNFIRKAVGYEAYLQDYAEYRKIKPEELTEVLDRLQESTRGMKNLSQWEDFIRTYTQKLAEQAQKAEKRSDGAVISTLHRVKGLEYPKVYILNVNEGSIPYRKAVLPDALEEERRLLYVGMTRSSKELTLCHVRKQYDKKREPSRFLKEAGL